MKNLKQQLKFVSIEIIRSSSFFRVLDNCYTDIVGRKIFGNFWGIQGVIMGIPSHFHYHGHLCSEISFSFWKAPATDFFSVGTVFKLGHSEPGSVLMLRPNKKLPDVDSIFRRPVSFEKVFFFGKNTLWTLNCPAHYRALGIVVTKDLDEVPDDVFCIKAIYTNIAKWESVLFLPAQTDPARIYRLYDAECQDLGTASVLIDKSKDKKNIRNSHRSEYCLKSNIANYLAEKPISKAFMTDVVFDMENMISTTKTGQLEMTMVQNRGSIPQTVTREITYTVVTSESFATSAAIALDVSVEITMQIPFTPIMAGVKGTYYSETSNKFGKTTEKSKIDTISVDVFVPENSQISAFIVTNYRTSTVPYSAMLEKIYFDGSRKRERIQSRYTGIKANEVSVQYGNVESLLEGRGDDNIQRKSRKAVSERPATKTLQVWHGESGKLTHFAENGVYGGEFNSTKAIDDSFETYFMSKRATKQQRQGLSIEFDTAKEIAEILLIPEKHNKHRYKNVCILADNDFEIACSDRDYQAGEKIKFIKEFSKEFFRSVTKTLKIVWDEEYARVADLKVYYFNPVTEYYDNDDSNNQSDGFENDIQYWKDCFTSPISEEKFPFQDQGTKANSFDDCAIRCLKQPECFVFNWMMTDGRCYLRSNWDFSLMGNALAESDVAKWKPWSGHRLTLTERSKLPKSPPTGRKQLFPEIIPLNISYKWNNAHIQVWTGSLNSAWATLNMERDYCSLGDKIIKGQEVPTNFNLLLKDESADQKWLVRPIDLNVSATKTSLRDVQIWEMVLPEGSEDFECLGHPVSNSVDNKPDPSYYCCVKKKFLIAGEEDVIVSSLEMRFTDPSDLNIRWSFQGQSAQFEYVHKPGVIDKFNFLPSYAGTDNENAWMTSANGGSITVSFPNIVRVKNVFLTSVQHLTRSDLYQTRSKFGSVQTWNTGQKKPAAYTVYGGSHQAFPANNLASKTAGMWHSDTSSGARGVTITFEFEVKVRKFEVTPRSDCCFDRYAGVALLIDGSQEPAALTPDSNTERKKFDMIAYATGKLLIGKEFKLDWFSGPDVPAQVQWIEIEYQQVLTEFGKVQTWNTGQNSPAAYAVYGGDHKAFPSSNLASKTAGMWHSTTSSAARGVTITFEFKVKIRKFEVTPRSDCCWDRYAGLALLIDGSKKPAALTPDSNYQKTKFDMIAHSTGESLSGKVFKLDWFSSPDGHYAQVEWIEIEYQQVLTAGVEGWGAQSDFDLRDSYADINFFVDSRQVGKSPSHLWIDQPRQTLDFMNWLNDPNKIVEGRVFSLEWRFNKRASASFTEITYTSIENGGRLARVVRGDNAPSGVLSGTFKLLSNNAHKPFLLRDGMDTEDDIHVSENWGSFDDSQSQEITIYQVPHVDLIWSNIGIHDKPISIWRTRPIQGYFNPGDIAVHGHASPGVGFLLKRNVRSTLNHFKIPDSYDLVFEGAKIGVKPSVCIWSLKCSPYYVPLGFIAKKDCEEPKLGDAYCVLSVLTEKIEKWTNLLDSVFDYQNSHNQGFIKRGIPELTSFDILPMGAFLNFHLQNTVQQTISTFKSAPHDIYAIKRSEGSFRTEKPILSTQISDVLYDFNNMEKNADPTEMNSAQIENYSHIPQMVTRTLSYTEESVFSFDFGTSVELGLTVEVGVGIPIPIIKSKINIDVAVTTTIKTNFETGKEKVESTTKSITAGMEIPDRHKMDVVIVATKYTTNIPYTATLTKRFYDGSFVEQKISGMFKGVNIDEVKVEYREINPIVSLGHDLLERKKRNAVSCGPDFKICAENAQCLNIESGHDCVCDEGFIGDGIVCVWRADDPCTRLDPCPPGIECVSSVEDNFAFECLCPENTRFKNNKCEQIVGDIVYKLIDSHELIWRASGELPLSIWRVRQFQMDYYSVGDLAVTSLVGNSQPMLKHLVLQWNKAGALDLPKSAELIQETSGGVRIYDLVPRSPDYTCLGSIAVKKGEEPDISRYCCVKNDYVTSAKEIPLFKWYSSALYGSIRSKLTAVIASTFKARKEILPNGTTGTYQLDVSDHRVTPSYDLADPKKVIDVFEIFDMTLIWKSSTDEYSIWRPIAKSGYHIVTHHVSRGSSRPNIGYMIKSSDPDMIAMPESYTFVKQVPEGYNLADKKVSAFIFSVNCPSGFVSLGAAVTTGSVPGPGEFYCIAAQFATPIISANVKPSYSPDLAFIEALKPFSEHCLNCPFQQGLNAILPASDWDNSSKHIISLPYILQSWLVNYYSEKPISRVVVTDISYDMNKAKYDRKPPQNLNTLTVINRSHIPQNVAKTLEFSVTNSKSFSFGVGIGFGTKVTLFDKSKKVGPAEFSAKIETEYNIETTFSYGEVQNIETIDSIEVAMEVSWTSKMSATITADKFTSNIPFVAKMKKYYFDGTTGVGQIEGIFNGVHMSNVHVQYGENKQLEPSELSLETEEVRNEETETGKEICHDPSLLRSSKIFSYPADKHRLLTVATGFGQKLTEEQTRVMFDGNLRTKLLLRSKASDGPRKLTFDFAYILEFKRAILTYEPGTQASEILTVCLHFDGYVPSQNENGCNPTFDEETGQMIWEDFRMGIANRKFRTIDLIWWSSDETMIPEFEILYKENKYLRSHTVHNEYFNTGAQGFLMGCWGLPIKGLVMNNRQTNGVNCNLWDENETSVPKTIEEWKTLDGAGGENLVCPWPYFASGFCSSSGDFASQCSGNHHSLWCAKLGFATFVTHG